eukprot:gnl/TRDRNA2_/TRDRNA2_189950_c0_seq1.p1 gnl/TRDRNA2_/TRDRNA2_189950_c0~~gnl/TRDRNA2_/TRDRNA2_189950_c0_seq1.p1  ORF type:complete len:443 (+),score=56.74 gnl/TRDRNA2_/TRDRNA2_189950_c0_seq1:51-1379(+)
MLQGHRQYGLNTTAQYQGVRSVPAYQPMVTQQRMQASGPPATKVFQGSAPPTAGFAAAKRANVATGDDAFSRKGTRAPRVNAASPTHEFVFPRTGKTVRNRSVLAAMTNRQSLADGTLSQDEHDWLVMRAENGFGMVTTACYHVSQDGQGFDGEAGVWSDDYMDGLTELGTNLRAHGAVGIMQIFHAGMRAPQHLIGTQPVSASANPTQASATGYARSLTEPEIWRIIEDFARAARRAADAGFDGVELHGAHGYLICQFLSTTHNQRRDCWGGSLENRARFLFEIIKAVKKVVPSEFLVGVRMSPEHEGVELKDMLKLASMLTNANIDFLHLSCWDSFKGSRGKPHDQRTLTEWFTTTIPNLPPIITAGNIWTPKDAQQVMNMGADFVAVARSAIGNPDWATRIADPGYQPRRPPYSPAHLRKCGLNDTFIHYMRNWQGFVM